METDTDRQTDRDTETHTHTHRHTHTHTDTHTHTQWSCGPDQLPDTKRAQELRHEVQPHAYRSVVQSAHDSANKALLKALRKDYRLLQRLASVRNYFFMRQGDLFIHFLETAEGA